jgi:hypothetical protein
VNSCLRFLVRPAVPAPGGLSTRGRQTIREVLTSRLFVVFFVSYCVALFWSFELGSFSWSRFARLSARGCQTVCAGRTIRGMATDRAFFEVQYWLFGLQFRAVHRGPMDCLPAHHRLPARPLQTIPLGLHRSPKSFAYWVVLPCCFELGFVPRVGRCVVATRPWQTRVGILGYEFGA